MAGDMAIPSSVTTALIATMTTTNATKKPPQSGSKKRRGAFHAIRTALFMLRSKGKKSKSLTASLGFRSLLFPAVRPTSCLNDKVVSPLPPLPPAYSGGVPPEAEEIAYSPILQEVAGVTTLHKVASSRSLSLSSGASSSGGMSRYASAQNLQELDNDEDGDYDEESENDAYYDGIEGDEMIDTKAEEFIAKFYQQMRQQQSNIAIHY